MTKARLKLINQVEINGTVCFVKRARYFLISRAWEVWRALKSLKLLSVANYRNTYSICFTFFKNLFNF